MPKRTKDYHAWLVQELKDPVVASNYLNEALADSPQMFLKALRNVGESWRISIVAKKAGVRRESLYRTLSRYGNPRLNTLHAVLAVLGLGIKVQPQSAYRFPSTLPEATMASHYRRKLRETPKSKTIGTSYQDAVTAVLNRVASGPANQKGPGSSAIVSNASPLIAWGLEKSSVQQPNFLFDVSQDQKEIPALLVVAEYAKQQTSPQTQK